MRTIFSCKAPQANSVSSADFDNDGEIDLAVTNRLSDNISILLGNGDGTFGTAVDYPVGDVPIKVVPADFDNDGNIDLAVTNRFSDNVSILMNNGDGTFADTVNYTVGNEPFLPSAADFDKDGNMYACCFFRLLCYVCL